MSGLVPEMSLLDESAFDRGFQILERDVIKRIVLGVICARTSFLCHSREHFHVAFRSLSIFFRHQFA